jgi:hypothetical protein
MASNHPRNFILALYHRNTGVSFINHPIVEFGYSLYGVAGEGELVEKKNYWMNAPPGHEWENSTEKNWDGLSEMLEQKEKIKKNQCTTVEIAMGSFKDDLARIKEAFGHENIMILFFDGSGRTALDFMSLGWGVSDQEFVYKVFSLEYATAMILFHRAGVRSDFLSEGYEESGVPAKHLRVTSSAYMACDIATLMAIDYTKKADEYYSLIGGGEK